MFEANQYVFNINYPKPRLTEQCFPEGKNCEHSKKKTLFFSHPYAPLLISLMVWKSSSDGGLMAFGFPWWKYQTKTLLAIATSIFIQLLSLISVRSPRLNRPSLECAALRCRNCRGSRSLRRNVSEHVSAASWQQRNNWRRNYSLPRWHFAAVWCVLTTCLFSF